MTTFTLSWKPLEGSPPYPDRLGNSVMDLSRGVTPACEFPLPAASGYGVCQVFCTSCRHLQNVVLTGRAGDPAIYKVECRKVAVRVEKKLQLELAV